MAPKRVRRAWATCPRAIAGTIDSSSGRASVTPTPFRNVRRDRCFLVRKLIASSVFLHALLELIRLDDAHQHRRETIAGRRGPVRDGAHFRHVGVADRPSGGI